MNLPLTLDHDGDIVDDACNLIAVITAGKATYSKLFVAAPEMHEVLRATLKFLEHYANPEANELWGKVTTVLAKFEKGEP